MTSPKLAHLPDLKPPAVDVLASLMGCTSGLGCPWLNAHNIHCFARGSVMTCSHESVHTQHVLVELISRHLVNSSPCCS